MSKVEKLLNKSSGKPAQDDSEAQTGGDSVTKIPPIRSFSTRRRQYTSAANLQTDGVDSSSHEQSPLRQTPSETIAHTIQELERLLAEAVQIAEMAAGVEDKHIKTETIERRPGSPSRRPTEGITEKVNKYLGEVLAKSREILPSADRSHGHVHVAQTDSSEPNAATEVPRDPPRDEDPCDREDCNPENLQLLPPEPVADPLGGKQPKLSKRTSSGQSSNPKRSVKFLEPPVVGPRTTSARRPSPIRSTPILQLNDIEVDEKEAEVKDSQGRPENPPRRRSGHERHFSDVFRIDSRQGSMNLTHGGPYTYKIDLNGARHVDIPDKPDEIDLHQTCRHSPVARNWPIARKRFAALVSCINTACLGLLLGIYSGEVPAIQYVIVDLDRSMILGNVFLYCGLVIPTLVFWPLPLLHGRKPYTIAALALSLCLQIPQGLMVISFRSPDMARYRVILLLSRGLSGIVFGFANINNLGTLLDVFGASLQSSDSHETAADVYDVRRHGGGMGVWLAIWSWCSIGSIGMGFVIGALIISGSSVDWGFWVSLVLLMGVLLLNIVAPEVRRSAFRRTIAEMIGEGGSYSRVARGEVKLHLTGNGPYWWGEEVKAGLQLSWKMIKQPGFLVLSIYTAWVYAQFTLILMVRSRWIVQTKLTFPATRCVGINLVPIPACRRGIVRAFSGPGISSGNPLRESFVAQSGAVSASPDGQYDIRESHVVDLTHGSSVNHHGLSSVGSNRVCSDLQGPGLPSGGTVRVCWTGGICLESGHRRMLRLAHAGL